jgi:hypothetical protein
MLQRFKIRVRYRKMNWQAAGFLTIFMLCSQGLMAESLVWFNGTFNGVTGVSNYLASDMAWNYIFDDFIVPAGGWQVAGALSHNLTANNFDPSTVNSAHWEIRIGISVGNNGTVVAMGTSKATSTPTGVSWSNYTEYEIAVSGLNVNLAPGTYWLAVAPEVNGGATYLSMTSGADSSGTPPGNNGNSWGIYAGSSYPENMDTRFGQPTDFSLGLMARTGASQFDALLPYRWVFSDLVWRWEFPGMPTDRWFDPPWAFGYNYVMTSESLFTGILDFPTGLGDHFNVSVGGTSLGIFSPGMGVDFTDNFPGGVSEFSVTGINPLVDAADPLAFPLKLSFNTSTADFDMQALPGASAIPEPSSVLLLGSGIAVVFLAMRRRLK